MPLKLFRATGFSALLEPGEARAGQHPAHLVLAASLWVALACNVAAWRWLAGVADARSAIAAAAILGGTSCLILSLCSWRRGALKVALTLVLLAGALLATGMWSQQLPVSALWQGPLRGWLPPWASLLRWPVLVLLLVLVVLPAVWVWQAPLRRVSARSQRRTAFLGISCGLALAVAGFFLV